MVLETKKVDEELLEELSKVESIGSKRRMVAYRAGTVVLRSMVEDLLDMGFEWMLPVMLSRTTDPLWPDPGASIEYRPELEIYGARVRTMQSMIVHKRVLVSLGPSKFFIISPNIRIEKRERGRSGWHLYEFTQLETEIAHATMKDVFRVYERLVTSAIRAVKTELAQELREIGRELRDFGTPFEVLSRRDLERKYGAEWERVLPLQIREPVWVTDIPREFYDYEDFGSGIWHNYDLFLPEGYGEVLSGAEREYEYEKMLAKIKRDGLRVEDYEVLLKLAKEGKLKPSAGAGLGVERFTAYVVGARHVAEVQPFPRVPGFISPL
ncbi:MAG: asparagine synthetase A [Thaumarchaeota archaeon]|nr:asparagine synthetase A [Candidatus Calditenuaceae archaeon]MDW8186559.1 asparagine synthetase A [Nitrososphaerota archaeon]